MNYIDLPKEACFSPLYSPRTTLSRTKSELDMLTTNLAINIDKYILGFFKDAFQMNDNKLTRNEFISQGLKHLKSWQRQLKYRNQKIHVSLNRLFEQADSNGNGSISWSQFNSMLIEKGLNLKTLRNQQPGNTALMKQIPHTGFTSKHGNIIQKMINLGSKVALFRQESSEVTFYNLDGSLASIKPLILSQQSLSVQTSVARRTKQGRKQVVKKDLVVAQYKNVILDMIYIKDSKYDILITSSTDFMVRGWDISSNIPQLAKQPQNQDQKMEHQFQRQIHAMAWDNINQILYCSGKSPTIHQWMVKTDSERELTDPDGHTQMLSAMIMMPKLQFLATGGYDGKLILWDTISQTKKFKYKEHTRAISSMAFHQNLILLFTSAYDHSICVWNPYIQSLIHKIYCNINVIQLDIIPDSNLLIALDDQSNIKIREVNKFTQISSFVIDRHDNRIQPVCMVVSFDPLKYLFGGLGVGIYQYVHIDSNVLQDSTALKLKYHQSTFTLYCPLKNHIVAWDILTGYISNTLRNQTISQITAFDMFQIPNLAVIGDNDGVVQLRKLQNGVLVKKLYKHRSNVTVILVIQSKHQKLIFSASYDGEVALFDRDKHGDFNHFRTISIKKMSQGSSITSLCYQSKRNTLAIGTNSCQLFFMDIDKNKLISRCQTKGGQVQHLFHCQQEHILLAFTKKTQIFGIYLPPHTKKFKPSCHLVSQQTAKISSVMMNSETKKCYIGFQNGDLMCFYLGQQTISNQQIQHYGNSQVIRHIWKNNFGQTIRNIIQITSQDTLGVIVGVNSVFLVSCQNGDITAELKQRQKNEPPAILYLDEQNDSIFIKSLQKFIPIKMQQEKDSIKRLFDPFFYLHLAQPYKDNFIAVSNPNWKFYPHIQKQAEEHIQNTLTLIKQIKKYEKEPKKLMLVKTESEGSFQVNKARQLQQKWEKQKQDQELGRTGKPYSLYQPPQSSNSFRQSNFKVKKNKESNLKHSESQHITNPLYKLGMALKNFDQKDVKAGKLMELGEKQYMRQKGGLKLPKISRQKDEVDV